MVHSANAKDRDLLVEAVEEINRMGLPKAARLSGLSSDRLDDFVRGVKPKYLQTATRTGLRKLLADPTDAQMRRRVVDALEEIAVGVAIMVEALAPVGGGDDEEDDE